MRIQGELPSDLSFSSELLLMPQTVVVRGPESRLAELDSIPLLPLDLGRVRDSEIVTLTIDTTGLGAPSVVPPDATVAVRVEPRIERELQGQVVHADVRDPGVTLTVEPPSIQLRVLGARTLVTAMDLGLLRVSIPESSLAGMIPGEERLVRVQVDGVPDLVTARPVIDVVTVTRVSDPSEDAGRDPS
jgi:YbbR domain-containing protein